MLCTIRAHSQCSEEGCSLFPCVGHTHLPASETEPSPTALRGYRMPWAGIGASLGTPRAELLSWIQFSPLLAFLLWKAQSF